MSILIKDIGMPESCARCQFSIAYYSIDGYSCALCNGSADWSIDHRPDWCPLIEIPDGHGRLIDADALMKEFEKAENTMAEHGQEYSFSFMSSSQEISTEWYAVEEMVDNSPTIIPSDKDGET